MNPHFYCKRCIRNVGVKVLQTYGKKIWWSKSWTGSNEVMGLPDDQPTKVRNWKRYGKVIVLAHQHSTGITGLFKTKQCPNSNTQVKMIVDEGSKEYELSDSELKKWIKLHG